MFSTAVARSTSALGLAQRGKTQADDVAALAENGRADIRGRWLTTIRPTPYLRPSLAILSRY
jgi:hypothetical protein